MINKLRNSLKNLFQPKDQAAVEELPDHEVSIDTKGLDKSTTPVDTKSVGYSSPHIAVGYGLSPGKQRNHAFVADGPHPDTRRIGRHHRRIEKRAGDGPAHCALK